TFGSSSRCPVWILLGCGIMSSARTQDSSRAFGLSRLWHLRRLVKAVSTGQCKKRRTPQAVLLATRPQRPPLPPLFSRIQTKNQAVMGRL
ncbi:hypothetical protein BGZ91_012164, partial [Linnemannia elongata]